MLLVVALASETSAQDIPELPKRSPNIFFSTDGKLRVQFEPSEQPEIHVWVYSADQPAKLKPVGSTFFSIQDISISPTGNWIIVNDGTASEGTHLSIFRRIRGLEYKDAGALNSEAAFSILKQGRKLPKHFAATHPHPTFVGWLNEDSGSFMFRLSGNGSNDRKQADSFAWLGTYDASMSKIKPANEGISRMPSSHIETSAAAAPSVTPVQTASPPSLGRIIVNTVPSNASVYLDGVSGGRTPIILQNISEGVHRIRLEAVGYDDTALVAEVKPGAASDLGTVHLPPKQPPPVAAPPPDQTAPTTLVTPPPLGSPGDNNAIPTSFSDFFGRVWGHQRTNDPSEWASDFANQVAYCYKDNGFASRSWVQQDRAKLIDRYPARDYELVGNPSFNPSSDLEIKAEYTYQYNYYGKKRSSGQAYVMFTATLENGEWRITKFNEVVNRN